MNYHKLGPSLADKRQTYSSHNLDLPMGSSAKKPDPKENKPNWLSMRTGGQYSKFQDDTPEQDVEDYNQRKDKVNKAIEDDRKIIEDAKKTNAPIYNQVDVSFLTIYSVGRSPLDRRPLEAPNNSITIP